jgi:hypothetical protein
MCRPIFGSRRRSSIEETCIRSKEITRILISDDRVNTVQDLWFGRGKNELKRVSNSASVLQCHFASLPKDREGISVIGFSSPLMCIGVRGETLFFFIRSASARNSCPATNDPFAASLRTQCTVGELSLKSRM